MAFIDSMFKSVNGDTTLLTHIIVFPAVSTETNYPLTLPCIVLNMILVDWDSFHLIIIVTVRHYFQNTDLLHYVIYSYK